MVGHRTDGSRRVRRHVQDGGGVLDRGSTGASVRRRDSSRRNAGGLWSMHAVTESAGMQRVLVMVHATLHRARSKRVSDAEDLMCDNRRDDDRRMCGSG